MISLLGPLLITIPNHGEPARRNRRHFGELGKTLPACLPLKRPWMWIFMSSRPTRTRRGGLRAGRLAAGTLAITAVLVAATGSAADEPAEDPSAVVMIGATEPAGALVAAGGQVPRHWRLETLTPRSVPTARAHG